MKKIRMAFVVFLLVFSFSASFQSGGGEVIRPHWACGSGGADCSFDISS